MTDKTKGLGPTDECRAEFERWIESELSYGYDLSNYDQAVGYQHEGTNDMWVAWQAALSHAGQEG